MHAIELKYGMDMWIQKRELRVSNWKGEMLENWKIKRQGIALGKSANKTRVTAGISSSGYIVYLLNPQYLADCCNKSARCPVCMSLAGGEVLDAKQRGGGRPRGPGFGGAGFRE